MRNRQSISFTRQGNHCRVVAGALVLLTGDVAHFGRFFGKTIAGVRILSPADFLREFKI